MTMTKHVKDLDPDGRYQKTVQFEDSYYHSNMNTLRVSSGNNTDTLVDFSDADLDALRIALDARQKELAARG